MHLRGLAHGNTSHLQIKSWRAIRGETAEAGGVA
jgi:hypothetical protein